MDNHSYNPELERIKKRAEKLEQENKNLHFELYQLSDLYKESINKIPVPILLFDKSGIVQFYNDAFVSILNFRGREIANKRKEARGVDVSELVEEDMYAQLKPFIERGDTFMEKDVTINDFNYTISIHPIRKAEFGLAIFRMTTTQEEKNEDMILRLSGVIETNLEMIQKIGSLMGEEVSKNTEILSSIIRMVK